MSGFGTMTGRSKKAPAAKRTTAKTPARGRAARRPAAAAKVAEKAATKAKASGAVGRSITTLQRQLRDSAIVARSAAGWTAVMIADEFEITERQVRRVLADRAALPSGADQEPTELLNELLCGFRASVGDFEAMAHRYREDHPAVAVSAKKAANDARGHYAELLAQTGMLPDDLALVRAEGVLRRLVEEMVVTVERVEAGELSPGEAAAFFREMVGAGDAPMNGNGQSARF
jgi:hypothetical protein